MSESKFSCKDADRIGCFICFADFDQPKQLPCHHIFCLKCLKTYRENKTDEDTKPCPVCYKEFSFPPGGVEKLPDGQFMMKYFEKKSLSEADIKTHKCDICSEIGENIEASDFCQECKQRLCLRCKKTHSVTTSTKFHNVVGIEETSNQDSLLNNVKSYCSTHQNKEIELYCCDCSKLLCYVCHFESHSKHMCKVLRDVVKQKKKKFTKDEGRIKNNYEEVSDQLKKRQQAHEKTLLEVTEAARAIQEGFGASMKILTDRKSQLLDTLEVIKENTLKEIDSQEDLDQMFEGEMNSYIAHCKMMMERGTDCEIIRVADELHKRAEEFIKIQEKCNKQQLPLCHIKFIPSPALTREDVERLTGKISLIGRLDVPPSEPYPPATFPSKPCTGVGDAKQHPVDKIIKLPTTQTTNLKPGKTLNYCLRLEGHSIKNQPKFVSQARIESNIRKSTECIQLQIHVRGLTVINDLTYFITEARELVHVYDTSTGKTKPQIKIPGLRYPRGIAGCAFKNIVYVSDLHQSRIYRVNLVNNSVNYLDTNTAYIMRGLSVTTKHSLLVVVNIEFAKGNDRIVEYTSEGEPIRDIELHGSIIDTWQAIKLSSNQFVICHGRLDASSHRLCLINSKGQIIKSYGTLPGKGPGQLYEPRCLALDEKRGHVLVTDKCNHRVLMFNRDLALLGRVQISDSLASPVCLFAASSDTLYVTEWGTGRLLITSLPD